MNLLYILPLALSLALKVFTIYFAAIAVCALVRRRRWPKAAPQTRFAVVVAARNEEAVIGDLIYSVLQQDYPAHLRDVFVVPNNCTDCTEAAASAAGAEILHCLGPVSCKGDALHQAFSQLRDRSYDAFLVFDADNTLQRDYLARLNDAFAAGAMVYVVVEELIPEMSEGKHSNVGTVLFAAGFTVMMALDVALG